MMRDFISIADISKEDIVQILDQALRYEESGIPYGVIEGNVVASLFFEPSTRTRLSFDSAIKRLGGAVIGFSGTEGTSMSKGETLEDTIKIIDGYSDCIVMRHPEIGSARVAADIAEHPLINAGDGANEHPTQTLLDLYAIRKTQGTLDGLRVAFVGDLKHGRVPHSLAVALTHFPTTTQVWVAPETLRMPDDVRAAVTGAGVTVEETTDVQDAINTVDILMMTRVQAERFADPAEYERVKDVYVLRSEQFSQAKKNMCILHPLPRRYELPRSIDALPQAYYFYQAHNGVVVRAAIVQYVLGKI